ncbi:hypothetical protein AYK24_08935 [Thermoplasmatales archaeon SG8-52-4]|nr:MAG: hypothetical protein AYK24_08935 [Thermoplasmatales archaeon SG8-52-4]
MRNKILGIIIVLMMMTSILAVAKNTDYKEINNVTQKINLLLFDEDDVPIWNEGDKWSYKLDSISIDFNDEDFYFYLEARSDNLNIKVIEVNEESYVINIYTPIDGYFRFVTAIENVGPINVTGEFKDALQSSSIGGTITFNKTDLAIKQANIIINGRVLLKFIEIPYYPFNLTPPLPIPIMVNLDIKLGNYIPIIDFPINTTKFWGIPSTNFTLAGTIESIWLDIISAINGVVRYPGVIEFLAERFGIDPFMLKQFSDILFNITPEFDIEYFLNEYIGGNVFELPEVPPILTCFSRDNITVDAGTYNSYNISVMGGLGNIYYAPEVGTIVKIIGNFEDVLPLISNINAELKPYSASYSNKGFC